MTQQSGAVRSARVGRATLRYYPPHYRQHMHDHDDAHVSLLLSGDLDEDDPRAAHQPSGGSVRFRPHGCRHAARFGSAGALMIAMPYADNVSAPTLNWTRPAQQRAFVAALGRLLGGGGEQAESELVASCLPALEPEATATTPKWLRAARERLAEDPSAVSIAGLADELGVHRVYFSRAFTAAFGQPPSVYRRAMQTQRALGDLVRPTGRLPEAAANAGFADQSHMCRGFAEFLGVSPGKIRRLIAPVTSVQAAND